MAEQGRAAVPPDPLGRRGDVVAIAGRDRDRGQRGEAQLAGEFFEILGDRLERAAVETDQVELVDREHDVANAEQ